MRIPRTRDDVVHQAKALVREHGGAVIAASAVAGLVSVLAGGSIAAAWAGYRLWVKRHEQPLPPQTNPYVPPERSGVYYKARPPQ